ncbi:hypothetical protein ODS41_08740 [Pyrobaculum sp. 3827-6]|uniref:hypothetical protein n=1 Tax=Pyrobaculum sp. 3827-6 TaxID=2983604 RepID=UPI0021D8DC0F|nr:hypothetical protein [Pyrobaculum sp. 3827-6]MCU7787996.1 hypothetical protein [Pyrobaculum sp. 3827-6]
MPWLLLRLRNVSTDLRALEDATERAVRKAQVEARGGEVRTVAEASKESSQRLDRFYTAE